MPVSEEVIAAVKAAKGVEEVKKAVLTAGDAMLHILADCGVVVGEGVDVDDIVKVLRVGGQEEVKKWGQKIHKAAPSFKTGDVMAAEPYLEIVQEITEAKKIVMLPIVVECIKGFHALRTAAHPSNSTYTLLENRYLTKPPSQILIDLYENTVITTVPVDDLAAVELNKELQNRYEETVFQTVGKCYMFPKVVLGSGGFGTVMGLGVRRAVKVQPPHEDLIHRELKIIEMLTEKPHERVVQFYGRFSLSNSTVVIVMEKCCGGSLHELKWGRIGRIASEAPFTQKEALHVTKQYAEALLHLKSLNVMNRDVSTVNFMAGERCSIEGDFTKVNFKMIDFGASFIFEKDAPLPVAHTRIGNESFIAPEVLAHTGYSYSVDVFSLGKVLVELTTVGSSEPPASLSPLISKMTDANPHARPTLEDVLADTLLKHQSSSSWLKTWWSK